MDARWLSGLVLLLAGCASHTYWEPAPAWQGFRPAQISVVERRDLSAVCGGQPHLLGCALRDRERNSCTVFVRAALPNQVFACVVTHETRHCVGDDHPSADKRRHFAVDCGNGERLSGPDTRAEGSRPGQALSAASAPQAEVPSR